MTYQRGNRIVLVHTSDPHTRLVSGTAGTVTSYDARLGQLAVAWDDGSTLAMLLNDGDQVRPLTRHGLRPERCPAPAARVQHDPGRGRGHARREPAARYH